MPDGTIKNTQTSDPRDQWQKDTAQEAVTHFKTKSRGQIIAPCGTGKTRITGLVWKTMDPQTTVVFTPSLLLTREAGKKWSEVSETYGFITKADHVLYIGSSKNHAVDGAQIDLTEEKTRKWTTDPKEVKAFMAQKGRRVVFC